MVVLRLRRGGRRHSPHYRIVAQEKRSKLNGAYIESLGHYHPTDKDKQLVIDADKVKEWMKNGAQLSATVNNLLVKEGVLPKKDKISRVYSNKKKSAKNAEVKAAEAPAKTEVAEEVKEEKAEEKKEDNKQESK